MALNNDGLFMDLSALVNELLLAGLENNEEGRKAAAVFRVFATHGIKVQEALEIMTAIMAIYGEGKK